MAEKNPRRNETIDALFDAILSLETREECYDFFEDLCTVKEISDMAQRREAAKLLLDGYPKSGFGYDTYFNNISMMASDSDRDTVRNYELQDRMAAVIRCFEGVKDAVVNISEGSDQRYVLDSETRRLRPLLFL